MHNNDKGCLVFSPSDLTIYMDSPFASWMDHYALLFPDKAPVPDVDDALSSTFQKCGNNTSGKKACGKKVRGNKTKENLITSFETQGLSVTRIADFGSVPEKIQSTIDAMHQGADVIYQAALTNDAFQGCADFLVKAQGQSDLGDHHYAVWASNPGSVVKSHDLIQLCCYVDMLETIQGCRPASMVVSLANGEQARFKVSDLYFYYLAQKQAFLNMHKSFDPDNKPDPASSRSQGRWSAYASELLEQRDHLSTVATISRSQIKKLEKAKIDTCAALIDSDCDTVPGMNRATFSSLKAQASIQQRSKGKTPPLYEVLPARKHGALGLGALPAASALDSFVRFERLSSAEGGLVYLWGASYADDSGFDRTRSRQFKDEWAHHPQQEKQALVAFIHWAYQRWQQDPSMHIYHYGNDEIATCRQLMGRYGVCEWEVDQLLRNKVFIDLYKIVKGTVLLGEPGYDLKQVETLYRDISGAEMGSDSDSVVGYDQWRDHPDGDTWQSSAVLQSIRDANMDYCYSIQALVEWLRERQAEHGIIPDQTEEIKEPEPSEAVTQRTQLRDELLAKAEQVGGEVGRVIEMLAWVLEFHRREAKPVFWRLFDRLGMTHTELLDDMDCLAYCRRTDRAPFQPATAKRKQNPCFEYRFDPSQAFKAPQGVSLYLLGEDQKKVTWVKDESDLAQGLIVLKCKEAPDAVISLIPDEYIATNVIEAAIEDVVRQLTESLLSENENNKEHLNQSSPFHNAISDFLYRKPPRFIDADRADPHEIKPLDPNQPLIDAAGDRLTQIIDTVVRLDQSIITLQGPPGAGKSYTGKHIIARLLQERKTVAIASNSHKAINHLLLSVVKHCQSEGIATEAYCTKDTGPELRDHNIGLIKNAAIIHHIESPVLIGATAFGLCREELKVQFDYLFIDEAGQVSVANLIGMSRCANNIVLMGDQMQLGQPSQGSHPGESGLSTLDYLLHDNPIIPAHIGIFLDKTYRMHSAVNQFISEAIYQGQLKADDSNDRQRLILSDQAKHALQKTEGLVFLPLPHEGNTQGSDEEVELMRHVSNLLLGSQFIDKDGNEETIGWQHMLFVAPYNHQVTKLKMTLGEQAKIGSVDKFQGQEAPIVFFSLCASDASESPRGIDFLFDKHRLNVAISRAQVLAVVVGNPALLSTPVNSVVHMQKANVIAMLDQYRVDPPYYD